MSVSVSGFSDQNNEGFKLLFENSPDAIFVQDGDGNILNVNQAACELHGIEQEKLVGMNIRDLVPASELEAFIERNRQWFNGKINFCEGIVYSAAGKKIPVELHGKIINFSEKPSLILIVRDITKRKEEEERIKLEKLNFENIFESSPDAIALTTLDGIIIDNNKAALELFKFTNGKKYKDFSILRLISRKDHKRAHGFIKSLIKKGSIRNKTFTLVKSDGTSFFAEVSASVLRDNDRRPANLIIIVNDITERLLYERRLEETMEKAVESDKLKSAFLANMSHEIRTPMNAIIGFSKLLSAQQTSYSDNTEYIEIIKNTGNTLLNLIDDIIDFAKIEAGEIKVTNSACNVHKVMRELYAYFEKEHISNPESNIDLILNLPDPQNELVMLTDQNRLRQILSNLLSNALKFTRKGKVEFGYQVNSEKINFYVSDTGIGIPEDKHKIIFDRFRQVEFNHNKKFGGTGLGLAITKNLVKLLGGDIWVESKKGKGTVLRFSLPLIRMESPEQKVLKTTPETIYYRWDDKVVLVVEDNDLNSKLLLKMMEPTGARVIIAKDGKPAIDECRANPEIDLVLMDIQMPEMDGYEATRTIKGIRPEIPIIAQTAYAMADERDKIISAGCNDYLSKPIRQKDLYQLLSKYLNQRQK